MTALPLAADLALHLDTATAALRSGALLAVAALHVARRPARHLDPAAETERLSVLWLTP